MDEPLLIAWLGAMDANPDLKVTMPNLVEDKVLDTLF